MFPLSQVLSPLKSCLRYMFSRYYTQFLNVHCASFIVVYSQRIHLILTIPSWLDQTFSLPFCFVYNCIFHLLAAMWRPGFDPWIRKIPWRRKRLPTPVFWPREFQGLYNPWGHRIYPLPLNLKINQEMYRCCMLLINLLFHGNLFDMQWGLYLGSIKYNSTYFVYKSVKRATVKEHCLIVSSLTQTSTCLFQPWVEE